MATGAWTTGKRVIPVLLACMVLGALASLPRMVRLGGRYLAVQKALKDPKARRRADLVPGHRTLAAVTSPKTVDLGYASFGLGSDGPVRLDATANGLGVSCVGDHSRISFLRPFSVPYRSGSSTPSAAPVAESGSGQSNVDPKEAAAHPLIAQSLALAAKDPLAYDLATEETRPLPFAKVARMGKDEFQLYVINLADKAGYRFGLNEVYAFTASHTQGLVRIGKSPQERLIAHAEIASLGKPKAVTVGCYIFVTDGSSADVGALLDPILSSFQFKVDQADDEQGIRRLISAAGIEPKEENSEDGKAEGRDPVSAHASASSSITSSGR